MSGVLKEKLTVWCEHLLASIPDMNNTDAAYFGGEKALIFKK